MAMLAFKEADKEAKHFKVKTALPAGFNTQPVERSVFFDPANIGFFTEATLSFPIPEGFTDFSKEEYASWLSEVNEVWDLQAFDASGEIF